MTELTVLDAAICAAVDPLTEDERRTFADDMHALFPDATELMANDQDAAMERAWHIASNKLFCDPLDPIGEAWSRFAGSLFAR